MTRAPRIPENRYNPAFKNRGPKPLIEVAMAHSVFTAETIRLRPVMYIGGTGEWGLQRLVKEVVDNSVLEFIHHRGTHVAVTLRSNGCIVVEDDGGGFPISDEDPELLKRLCTELVAPKHRWRRQERGLFGIGLPTVCALSDQLLIETSSAGRAWRAAFSRGQVVEPIACFGPSTTHGAKVVFRPDAEIFRDAKLPRQAVREYLFELSFLYPGLAVRFTDETSGEQTEFLNPDGMADLVRHLSPVGSEVVRVQTAMPHVEVDLAFRIVGENAEHRNYACGNRYELGGACWGVIHGVVDALRSEDLKLNSRPNVEWLRNHMVSAVSLQLDDPLYEGPTKERLSNRGLAQLTQEVTRVALRHALRYDSTIRNSIVRHLNDHIEPAP